MFVDLSNPTVCRVRVCSLGLPKHQLICVWQSSVAQLVNAHRALGRRLMFRGDGVIRKVNYNDGWYLCKPIATWLDKGMVRSSTGTKFERRFYVRTAKYFPLSLWISHCLLFPPRYKKAYESMKACPLTFTHPSEAQQLNGLGSKLCDRLAERLKEHCEENGLQMPEVPQNGGCLLLMWAWHGVLTRLCREEKILKGQRWGTGKATI